MTKYNLSRNDCFEVFKNLIISICQNFTSKIALKHKFCGPLGKKQNGNKLAANRHKCLKKKKKFQNIEIVNAL